MMLRPPTGKRFGASLAASIALVTILAGCSASSALPSTAPTASVTPSVAPSATPTPAPAAQAGPPRVRVPFGCEALYTAATARPLVGVKLVPGNERNATLDSLYRVAERQAGMLDCSWEGGVFTDFGRANGLNIVVTPDGAATYDANVASSQPAKFHPVVNTAGDKSSYYCRDGGVGAEGYSCFGEMVVGTDGVSLALSHAVPVKPAVAAASLRKAMDRTAATLRSSGPGVAAWTPPTGAPSKFCADPESTSRVRAAIGDSSAARYKYSSAPFTAYNVGYSVGYSECLWTTKRSETVDITIVPGGGWAFPEITPSISIDSTMYGTKFVSWSIPGARSALVACNGSCDAFLAVGDTAANIVVDDSGKAKTTAVLAKLVEAIKLAG